MKPSIPCNLLKELRAFCVTREEGTMKRASEILQLSHPTISYQINTLERELNIQLFLRHGPRISITSEGKAFYDLVSPLIQSIDTIKDSFTGQLNKLSSGELSIAAEDSTLLYALPNVVKTFIGQYPGIRLKLNNLTEQGSRDSVLSEASDFAISLCGHPSVNNRMV